MTKVAEIRKEWEKQGLPEVRHVKEFTKPKAFKQADEVSGKPLQEYDYDVHWVIEYSFVLEVGKPVVVHYNRDLPRPKPAKIVADAKKVLDGRD